MRRVLVTAIAVLIAWVASTNFCESRGQEAPAFIFPEQRHLEIRNPCCLPKAHIPPTPPPRTVQNPLSDQVLPLSLDEAIRIALDNACTIRRLAGLNVVSTGRTIYDPAIQNTGIDQARARFDPSLQLNNQFKQSTHPSVLNFLNPNPLTVIAPSTNEYDMTLSLQKNNVLGGTSEFGVTENSAVFSGENRRLDSLSQPSIGFGYNQPLLQGAGTCANLAPIVIARIQTEGSFFQTKDSVQELVRGVIEAYWSLLAARIDAWARHQQVDQGLETFHRAEAQMEAGLGTAGDVAQSRAALANFRAELITAEGNVLQREAVLRNILGLPPFDPATVVPTTPPATERLETQWNELLALAEDCRPDVIELKLILEADRQQLIIASNQALPRLDASAQFLWNGVNGTITNDGTFNVPSSQWQVGVNFSVPLGLRKGRANMRQKELVIAQDQSNLQQGLHAAAYDVAASYRNLVQYYEQYLAYKETAAASRINLEQQIADFHYRRGTLYLNVLQAITELGNAVRAEAQSLALYNTELANLETRTGTILESHGIRFVEERFRSAGPFGRWCGDRCYPMDERPLPGYDQYPVGPAPSNPGYEPLEPLPPGTGTTSSAASSTEPSAPPIYLPPPAPMARTGAPAPPASTPLPPMAYPEPR